MKDDFMQYIENTIEIHKQIGTRNHRPVDRYSCFEELIITKGQRYKSQPLTGEELGIVNRAIGQEVYPERYCFRNARLLVLKDKSQLLMYNEGIAAGIIPVLHAWATINNKVIDLTWQPNVFGTFTSTAHEYYGMKFDKALLIERNTSKSASMIDNWEERWPLLKK